MTWFEKRRFSDDLKKALLSEDNLLSDSENTDELLSESSEEMVKVPENVFLDGDETEPSVSDDHFVDNPDDWEELKINPYQNPELTLPESIYTACLLVPAAFDAHEYRCGSKDGRTNYFIVAQVYFLFFVNVCVQCVFAVYVKILFEDQSPGDRDLDANDTEPSHSFSTCGYGYTNELVPQRLYSTDFYLRILCLAAFAVFCLQDLFQTMWMLMWVYYLPTTGCGIEKVKIGLDQEDKTSHEIKNGLPMWLKLINTFFVLMPKLFVAATLLCWGGGFVVGATSNEDVLLNSLALVFVIELDEYMYSFALPKNLKKFCEEMPPVIPNTDFITTFTYWNSLCGMIFNFIILMGTTQAMYWYFCRWPEQKYWPDDIFWGL